MEQSPSTPPLIEAVPDIPIENIADLPAEVAGLRELLARLTDERGQFKKKAPGEGVQAVRKRTTSAQSLVDRATSS